MSIATTREQRRQLARDNAKLPLRMVEIPRSEWPPIDGSRHITVWRSRDFLAQVVNEGSGIRLSIHRTEMVGDRWRDGITWDELQRVKSEIGFGAWWAVECFPPAAEVVNVANIRHLWLLSEPPMFGWHKGAR